MEDTDFEIEIEIISITLKSDSDFADTFLQRLDGAIESDENYADEKMIVLENS